jgi:dihydrofolate reductase
VSRLVFTLIAAMDQNHLLANASGIPWKLPRDVAHFRAYCRGKWLLLGRRTFSEMRGWFEAGYTPLVLSSSCGWDPDVGRVVASVPQAIALAESAAQAELVCVGGGQTFAASLPYANRMVLTFVERVYPPDQGAVYFPEWDSAEWRVGSENALPKENLTEPAARVLTLERAAKQVMRPASLHPPTFVARHEDKTVHRSFPTPSNLLWHLQQKVVR